ncbi:MAG: NFACT RNA binding domain-containing protein [Cyanobacteria bacterium J069]
MAACAELRASWLPARLEQVVQRDRHTIALCLRTFEQRGWLTVSWHPQAARICIDTPPPKGADTFTFSQQLRHQLNGLALVAIEAIAPWERVLDLQFARRPGDPALWHLYVEIMGKYSNVVLTTAENQIVTVAHQVSAQQSSVRPVLTGQPYEFPPGLTDSVPSLDEPRDRWQERVALIPGPLKRNLLKAYRGLSSALVLRLISAAGLEPEQETESLTEAEWARLGDRWQAWLTALQTERFSPGWLPDGYTVLGWDDAIPAESVQALLSRYYTDELNRQVFSQLRHQLNQRLSNLLNKLYTKANDFQSRLTQSDDADRYRQQADLLMAHLHAWQPGLKVIELADFETGKPVKIALDPEKNAVQNAQALYKRHQKLRRSRLALEPLLTEAQAEIHYLEQVQVAVLQVEIYTAPEDLEALEEIREELVQQRYLDDPDQRYRQTAATTNFRRYHTPSGFEVLIGRNNHQNDQLISRTATDYDLWFHSQEIPGSHVLLRLPAGASPDDADLQFTADLAAYYSRATQSDQVPVIYTEPRYVFKPKGARPGTVIYKQEQVLWGQPQRAKQWLETSAHSTPIAPPEPVAR